jgi:hypothetical protein
VYDIGANAGFVNVGTDHDTAAFAVESIRRWWQATGHSRYPGTRRLLVTADAASQLHEWDIHIVCFATDGTSVTEIRLRSLQRSAAAAKPRKQPRKQQKPRKQPRKQQKRRRPDREHPIRPPGHAALRQGPDSLLE